MSLYAGSLLADRLSGANASRMVPAVLAPLPRFPLHNLIRIPQRAMYRWYKFLDNSDPL